MLLDYVTPVNTAKTQNFHPNAMDKFIEQITIFLDELNNGIPVKTIYVYYSHVGWRYQLNDNSMYPYMCYEAELPLSHSGATDYKEFDFDGSIKRSRVSFTDIHSHIYNAITDEETRRDLKIEVI